MWTMGCMRWALLWTALSSRNKRLRNEGERITMWGGPAPHFLTRKTQGIFLIDFL